MSCDNEVDINSDYEEVALVYGLLDKNAETQFIKINRTFLDDNLSAIDLAQQSEKIHFDTLTVILIDNNTGSLDTLKDTVMVKQPGAFSTEDNVLYYTTKRLKPRTSYQLKIIKPDGTETFGTTTTIDTINVIKPRTAFGQSASLNNVKFINPRGLRIINYEFEFSTGRNIAEFQVRMHFHYKERTSNGEEPRVVSMNIGKLLNTTLNENEQLKFSFPGELFFKAIEEQVKASLNPSEKIIDRNDYNIDIEIFAADPDYSFYRELNGPIDGLAQTRPEFTNIENGIGLFASRFSMIAKSQIDQETRNYLIQKYKDNRNFTVE